MKSGDFICITPLDWKETARSGAIFSFESPDEVHEVSAYLSVSRGEETDTRENLAEIVASVRSDGGEGYKQDPLTEVTVGKFKGLMWSETYLDDSVSRPPINIMGPGTISDEVIKRMKPPRKTPLPPPVMYKETHVYFKTPGGYYQIDYGAPVTLYEKYRPAFERLLKTFKWTGATQGNP